MKYKVLIEKVQYYEYIVDAIDGPGACDIAEKMFGLDEFPDEIYAPEFEAIDYECIVSESKAALICEGWQ